MSSTGAAQAEIPRRRLGYLRRREIFWFYAFISPWIIGFLVFQLGPIVAAAYFSFTNLTDLSLDKAPDWVGFHQYSRLFTSLAYSSFRDGLRATAIFVGVGVPLRIFLALMVAQLLNQKIPFLWMLRTVYYMPTVVAGVAAALLWETLLDPVDGIVNVTLRALHLPAPDWLADGTTAMGVLLTYNAWYLGTAMVVFLAALQGVPTELYEAAGLDGANAFRRFWHISLPQVSPTILFATIIGIISALQEFVAPFVLTSGGGPINNTRLLGLDLYQNAIVFQAPGHTAVASAEAMFLFIVALALTTLIFFGSRRFVYYAGERDGGL